MSAKISVRYKVGRDNLSSPRQDRKSQKKMFAKLSGEEKTEEEIDYVHVPILS